MIPMLKVSRPILLLVSTSTLLVSACSASPPDSNTVMRPVQVSNDWMYEQEFTRSIGDLDRVTQRALADLGFEIVDDSREVTPGSRRYDAIDGIRIMHITLESQGRNAAKIRVYTVRMFQGNVAMFEYDRTASRQLLARIGNEA